MANGLSKNYLKYRAYVFNTFAVYKNRQDVRSFLEILLSLAALSLFDLFALRPTVLTIANLYRDIQTKKELVKKMDAKIVSLQAAQRILAQETKLISLLETAIPKRPQPEVFSRQLQGVGNKDGITVTNLVINGTTLKTASSAASLAGKMQFSVATKGDYPNLVSFLTDLENLRNPIGVQTFNIESIKTEKETSLNLVVTGDTPYLGK